MEKPDSDQGNANEAIVHCLIDGVTVNESIFIPICAATLIERSAYVVKQILHEYGDFTINDVPQFSQNSMLLGIRPKNSSDQKLDLAHFETFVMNFANYLQEKREGACTTPGSNCMDKGDIEMDRLSKKIEGQGTIHIGVHSNSMIKLVTGACASKASQHTHEFSTTEVIDFASIQHFGKEFLMNPDDANGLRVGDAISIADLSPINDLQCIIAKIIWIQPDDDFKTLDLFDHESKSDT